jgi:hypothetical protein
MPSWTDRIRTATDRARQTAGDTVHRTAGDPAGTALRQARSAASQASRAAASAGDTVGTGLARARAAAADVEWQDLIARVGLPSHPITTDWRLSLGTLVAADGDLPRGVERLLGLFDRFGAIAIGRAELGFDGDTVPWSKLTEIRTRTLGELVYQALADDVVDRLAGCLPPVPGRRWTVRKAVGAATTLLVLCTDVLASADDAAWATPVPCELAYRGMLWRTRETGAGLLTGPMLALLPEAGAVIAAEAKQRGIPLVPAPPSQLLRAGERARWLRERRAALLARRAAADANPQP